MFAYCRSIGANVVSIILCPNDGAKSVLRRRKQLFCTSRKAARRGYSLVSQLLSFIITIMVIELILIFIQSFKQLPKQEMTLDLAYGIKEVTQLVNTATEVEVYDTSLVLNKDQTLSLHNQRLVVQPGFNIILHHIDACYFEAVGDHLWMELSRDKMKGRYYVGVIYRPEKRVEPLPDPSESNDDVVSY